MKCCNGKRKKWNFFYEYIFTTQFVGSQNLFDVENNKLITHRETTVQPKTPKPKQSTYAKNMQMNFQNLFLSPSKKSIIWYQVKKKVIRRNYIEQQTKT